MVLAGSSFPTSAPALASRPHPTEGGPEAVCVAAAAGAQAADIDQVKLRWTTFAERLLDKFSSFFLSCFGLHFVFRFVVWGGSGRIFRFSGVFCVDSVIFRPTIPPGA